MLRLLEKLPVELVGTNVLGYLSLKDIVMLERACGSKISHQLFLDLIPYCPPLVLPSCKHTNQSVLDWFSSKKCKIESLTIQIPGDNPGLCMSNLLVLSFDLQINYHSPIERYKFLFDNNVGHKVRSINIKGGHNSEIMEQLSVCTGNVEQLTIIKSYNNIYWLTVDILARWKLKNISLDGPAVTTSLVKLMAQTCSELTSIELYTNIIDDAAVIAIAEHCPKLATLLLRSSSITWTSLLDLSERGLPLEELDIAFIPHIPTANIARRCSHALSCIRHQSIYGLHQNSQDATILIPYMTGLFSVDLNCSYYSYLPLLTQYCHKLTFIEINGSIYAVKDVLLLFRANPLLQVLNFYYHVGITDTALIELIHACPHLRTLYLPYETDITDTGILALSVHCTQLQELSIYECHKVTEAAVLQLLQCCRKLTRLYVSTRSLSEETWTQLDNNSQKRVRRCY